MPRTYKEYPSSYFSILERFEENPIEMRIELPARDAFGRRRDFYRLGDVLSQIIQTDSYARRIHSVLRDLVFSIRPPTARGDEPCELVIGFNKMNKAVEDMLGIRDNLAPPGFLKELDKDIGPQTGEAYDIEKLERIIKERGEK